MALVKMLQLSESCGSVIGNDDSGRVALHRASAFGRLDSVYSASADRRIFGRRIWRRQLQRGLPYSPRDGKIPLLGKHRYSSALRVVRIGRTRHPLSL